MTYIQNSIGPQLIKNTKIFKKQKKISNNLCQKVMIYTNNQGPKKLGRDQSKDYLEYKLESPLFDQIIAAYYGKWDIM